MTTFRYKNNITTEELNVKDKPNFNTINKESTINSFINEEGNRLFAKKMNYTYMIEQSNGAQNIDTQIVQPESQISAGGSLRFRINPSTPTSFLKEATLRLKFSAITATVGGTPSLINFASIFLFQNMRILYKGASILSLAGNMAKIANDIQFNSDNSDSEYLSLADMIGFNMTQTTRLANAANEQTFYLPMSEVWSFMRTNNFCLSLLDDSLVFEFLVQTDKNAIIQTNTGTPQTVSYSVLGDFICDYITPDKTTLNSWKEDMLKEGFYYTYTDSFLVSQTGLQTGANSINYNMTEAHGYRVCDTSFQVVDQTLNAQGVHILDTGGDIKCPYLTSISIKDWAIKNSGNYITPYSENINEFFWLRYLLVEIYDCANTMNVKNARDVNSWYVYNTFFGQSMFLTNSARSHTYTGSFLFPSNATFTANLNANLSGPAICNFVHQLASVLVITFNGNKANMRLVQ